MTVRSSTTPHHKIHTYLKRCSLIPCSFSMKLQEGTHNRFTGPTGIGIFTANCVALWRLLFPFTFLIRKSKKRFIFLPISGPDRSRAVDEGYRVPAAPPGSLRRLVPGPPCRLGARVPGLLRLAADGGLGPLSTPPRGLPARTLLYLVHRDV